MSQEEKVPQVARLKFYFKVKISPKCSCYFKFNNVVLKESLMILTEKLKAFKGRTWGQVSRTLTKEFYVMFSLTRKKYLKKVILYSTVNEAVSFQK